MNMANGNSKVLTAEQEMQIRRPIEEYVGAIQKQIDGLRVDGTDKVLSLEDLDRIWNEAKAKGL